MTATTLPLRRLIQLEWRYAPRRAAWLMALLGVMAVALTHVFLPLFPERVIDFMKRGFRLEDMAGVLVLNDLLAIYFPAFFFGLSSSIGAVIAAREEHRLELLLAKPVRAGDLVVARLFPALASTVAVGVAISLATALAVAVQPGIGDSVAPSGALGGGLVLTALALVVLAAVQVVFVHLRDPFQGILIASIAWFATVLPSAVLLYRPDAFAGHEALMDLTVMSSLLWHDDAAAWLGPIALVVALPLATVLAHAAGDLLERSDAL